MRIPYRLLPQAAAALLLVDVTACNQDDSDPGVEAEDTDDTEEDTSEEMDDTDDMDEEMDETEG
jgi:hypothetical protein